MNEDSDEDNFDVNLAFVDSLVNSPDDVCSVHYDEYDMWPLQKIVRALDQSISHIQILDLAVMGSMVKKRPM